MPHLETDDGLLSPEVAGAGVYTPPLLELTDEMREFVDRYASTGTERQKLMMLHQSLLSPALVGIRYDPMADGSAADAFNSGAANCLSYANLFVALARYAGLDARYLSMTLRPEWSRHGDQVALRTHVNVKVRLHNGQQYVVDIDPVSRDRIATTDVLSDREAFALYHGNIAMDALLAQDRREAYAQAVRALELGPEVDFLWVNLGAIYRNAGQESAAEAAYLTALDINYRSSSAMNNLAVLYDSVGDTKQRAYWEEKVHRHRMRNPYYHYYLGEEAEQRGDTDAALAHYMEAISLKKSDAEFYFRVAQLYKERQQFEQSIIYTRKAIEYSRLVGEREEYRQYLRQLTDRGIASLGSGAQQDL